MNMVVENELPDLTDLTDVTGLTVPTSRRDAASDSPDLLEAELFGLEETLNILREEFTTVAPGERAHVARHMRETRVRIARIRMRLILASQRRRGPD